MSERDQLAKQSAGGVSAPRSLAALEGVDGIVRGTVEELNRMLDTRQVVGEPMTFGDTTIIPLVSVGFGFGAGGGGGSGTNKGQLGQGGGGGGAGGGGVKPVALVVVDPNGVRLVPVQEPTGLGKLSAAVAEALKGRGKSGDAGVQTSD